MSDLATELDTLAARLAEPQTALTAEHRTGLIGCLRAACAEDHDFDEAAAWRTITLFAYSRQIWPKIAMGPVSINTEGDVWRITAPTVDREKPDVRRERAEAIEKAMREARALFERTLTVRPNGHISETAADFIRAWSNMADPMQAFQTVLDGMAAIEAAARMVADQNRQTRGRPIGGALPADDVRRLVEIYTDATGRRATTTDTGPFMIFVRAVVDALAIPIKADGLLRAVKAAFRQIKAEMKAE